MILTVLTWVSLITGGLLVLLFLLSLLGGLELDIEFGSTDIETDAGGIGLIKGCLTFVSISSWVMKVLLVTNNHPGLAIGVGLFSGLLAFLLLNWLFKLLLKNESNVNWKIEDALFAKGEVYLKIPEGEGTGIVNLDINGANRELKATTEDKLELQTGTKIYVTDIETDHVIVARIKS